ncbi:Transglycosylase [Chitinophaga ginsengisegetis]|uniref:Transglycosylase n=1 Tax=Chitinophaga ginsengisegetis TaxID=393003 RepID=A0A1T5PC86_9BACT|nr:biosynthetic peptidoglycan transglycosylase [Chitinophaga ginsengisegetis]SKD10360.1 Transglycosylase [Chitinophaga ginsengisegetis]
MQSNVTKPGLLTKLQTSSVARSLKEKILLKIKSRYRISADFGIVSITSINSVKIKPVSLYNNARNMICETGSIQVKFSWYSLLKGRIKLISVKISDCKIVINKRETIPANTTAKSTVVISPQDMIRNFYKRISTRVDIAFESIPPQVNIENLEIILSGHKNVQVKISSFALNKRYYNTAPGSHQDGRFQPKGIARKLVAEKQLTVDVGNFTMVADLQTDTPSTTVTAKQLTFRLSRGKDENNGISYDLETNTHDLTLHNSKVSNQQAFTCDLGLMLYAKPDSEGFHIDRQSCFHLNNLRFPFYLDHFYRENDIIELGVNLVSCQMEDILKSFQDFTTQSLYRSSFSGTLGFFSRLRFELTNSFKREFEIKLDNNLRILDHGGADYSYLKQPFVHNVYDGDIAVKSINLDSGNSFFLPLDKISADLKKVIICTEDPHYYTHKGIDSEAIFLAMASNIKSRKLSRGASTITMQVVRNLFLYHRKNFQRKIEEVILTWYLEEVFSIGKDRILEIYLNIIELGPGIYGVQEAAYFYFDKPANQLTLTESLALAYIIPRPKFFLEALKMNSPKLRKNLTAHILHNSKVMLKKDIISLEEFENIQYKITFAPSLGELNLTEAEAAITGS